MNHMGHTTSQPHSLLQGILVLDFSQFLAGPFCALRLADMGADVIKVERPQGGDLCRQLVVGDQRHGEDSTLFHAINRNKRSFAADLKQPQDLEHVRALIRKADVMIQNFRPGVMARIGLDADAVLALNPRIVYGEVTGYGHVGPWRDKPGQDLLVQALSGMTWLNGNADQDPVPIGLSIVDLVTGAHLTQGVLAALLRRERSGQGGVVSVSLMESAMDLQVEPFTMFLNGDRRQPSRSAVNHANVHIPAPYGIYRCADGYLALAMVPQEQLAQLLDCPALMQQAADAAFDQRDAIKAILRDHLRTQSVAHWLARLEPGDVWCAPVQDWPQLTAHAGFAALNLTQEIRSTVGTLHTTRCPIRFDGQALTTPRPAPRLGEHNDEILAMLAAASS